MKNKLVIVGLLALLTMVGLYLYFRPVPFEITTTSKDLPIAICGQPYHAVIKTHGGKGPTTWQITINDPAFLWIKAQVEGNNLVITGIPPVSADGSCQAGKQIEQFGKSLGIRL